MNKAWEEAEGGEKEEKEKTWDISPKWPRPFRVLPAASLVLSLKCNPRLIWGEKQILHSREMFELYAV